MCAVCTCGGGEVGSVDIGKPVLRHKVLLASHLLGCCPPSRGREKLLSGSPGPSVISSLPLLEIRNRNGVTQNSELLVGVVDFLDRPNPSIELQGRLDARGGQRSMHLPSPLNGLLAINLGHGSMATGDCERTSSSASSSAPPRSASGQFD